jgi:hypothetical protein
MCESSSKVLVILDFLRIVQDTDTDWLAILVSQQGNQTHNVEITSLAL